MQFCSHRCPQGAAQGSSGMTNRPKQRGTAAETKVVRWLNDNGHPQAERRALAGALDKGDVLLPGESIVIECKDVRADMWGKWLNETLQEQVNAKADFAYCVRRRVGRPDVGDWFALTTVRQMNHLLRIAGYGDAL